MVCLVSRIPLYGFLVRGRVRGAFSSVEGVIALRWNTPLGCLRRVAAPRFRAIPAVDSVVVGATYLWLVFGACSALFSTPGRL